MKIHQIRNSTLKISYAGKTILTDPVLLPKHGIESFAGKEKNPTIELPMPAKEVIKDIDMVIVSHLHQDHFDAAAKEMLPKDITIFCQPGDESKIAESNFTSIIPVEDEVKWEGITITRTPGIHAKGEKWRQILGKVSGFVLQADNEPVLYWTGDTIFYEEVEKTIKKYNPKVILTHSCGAQLDDSGPIVMDAQMTIDTCNAASDAIVVATHMEALDHAVVTRSDLREFADKSNVDETRLLIPENGQVLTFEKSF